MKIDINNSNFVDVKPLGPSGEVWAHIKETLKYKLVWKKNKKQQ